ncbi:MAG: serine/threonine protein kinase [Lentisphaeria bacterium]|nr:serine/threonine protein kinase [Lentisphaeria bacterium]
MSVDDFLLEPGVQFGDYRIVSELGRGNNGVVYLAEQEPLDRKVALKVLLPERSAHREYVELLINEARSAARLCHPNIVQALDAGSCDGRYYLAMEFVNGRTLEDIRLEAPELISLELLVDLSIQLADALDYAWANFQITHGDIKPENLLICNNNHTLKLADLGLANISDREDPEQDGIMATPMYVAPEVISGTAERGVRSDIYSFGVMFYELVAGKPPFRGDTEHLIRCHLEEPVPPLLVANPDIPAELAEFTHKMLEKDPARRPQSWKEIREYLEDFRIRRIDVLRQPQEEPPPEPQGESPLPRVLLWSVVALLALVLLGGVAVMVWLIFFRTRL